MISSIHNNQQEMINFTDPSKTLHAIMNNLKLLAQRLSAFSKYQSANVLHSRISLQLSMISNQLFKWQEKGIASITQKDIEISLKHFSQSYKSMARDIQQVFEMGEFEGHQKDPALKLKVRQAKEKKLKRKIEVLREVQKEIEQQWENDGSHVMKQRIAFGKQNIGLRKLNNIVCLSDGVKAADIPSLAKQHLHQQFLAIRMISLRMYEHYNSHAHPTMLQKLESMRMEQSRLQKQIAEEKQNAKQLKDQSKRLERDVSEIRRVNDMIGERYFITADHVKRSI